MTQNHPLATVAGGVVTPANSFAVPSPWLAVIGLVGSIATAVMVAKHQC